MSKYQHFIGFEPMTISLENYCSNPTELKMLKHINLSLTRFELMTLRLSGVYSNQLSYKLKR